MRKKSSVLLLFLLIVLLWGCEREQALKIFENKPPAPALVVPLLSGGELSLEDWKGQPVVVNFWASWCPPCREEIPSMNRAWDKLGPAGVKMVAVNLGEPKAKVSRFLDNTPIDFPVALDTAEEHSKRWPVPALPMTFIIDADGRAVYSAAGPREWDAPDLLEKITALSR